MKLEGDALWAAMSDAPDNWHETTEDMYYATLGAVPPLAMHRRSFLAGEPAYTNEAGENVYAFFWAADNETTARYMTLAEFKRFWALGSA